MRLVLSLLAVLALLLAGCGTEETALEEAEEEGRAEALIGETITVRGEVAEVLGEDAVVLNAEPAGVEFERGTLVIGEDMFSEVNEDDFLEVTGTVVEFTAEDYNEPLFEGDLFGPFEDEFAIRADSHEVIEDAG